MSIKDNRKVLIVIASIVILANTWPFTPILSIMIDKGHYQNGHYRYSNYNGSLTFVEYMSRDFEMMKRRHKGCLLYRPELKDKHIYRLFWKNPFAFWRWRSYIFDKRYELPYRDWDEIKKVREKENIKEITGCSIEF